MKSYQDLIVWQKSLLLAKEIYRITAFFPESERFGLSAQLRRAAVSIPSNIAEGFGRMSIKENARFLSIAFGSSCEVETQLLLARELEFASEKEFVHAENLLLEVRKMLNTMLRGSRSRG